MKWDIRSKILFLEWIGLWLSEERLMSRKCPERSEELDYSDLVHHFGHHVFISKQPIVSRKWQHRVYSLKRSNFWSSYGLSFFVCIIIVPVRWCSGCDVARPPEPSWFEPWRKKQSFHDPFGGKMVWQFTTERIARDSNRHQIPSEATLGWGNDR